MQRFILSVLDVMHGVTLSVHNVTGVYHGESLTSFGRGAHSISPRNVDTAEFFEFLNAHFTLAPLTDDLVQRRVCVDFIHRAQSGAGNASGPVGELLNNHLMAAAICDGGAVAGFLYQGVERPGLWGFMQGDLGCAQSLDFVRDVLRPIFRFHGLTDHDITTQNNNFALYCKLFPRCND